MTTPARQIRQAPSEAYGAEDFACFFQLSQELSEADPDYAQSHEHRVHLVLHALDATTPGLRFLQVGAVDGKIFDPIYPFVKHYSWAGLVLEPLGDLFAVPMPPLR